jgi:L-ascorbate metabolism protein UlaG (beta-lactamase superfamily)
MKLSLGDLKYFRRISEGYLRRIPPAPQKPDPRAWRNDELTLAWLGHSTVLLNLFGVWVLTDPALCSRVGLRFGPLTFGPKRYVAPALRVRDLPPLDVVLLTHAHMDHFDLGTLRQLPRNITVVTAAKTRDLLEPLRFARVIELGWNESQRVDTAHGDLNVEAFRVRHWGARMRTDVHRGFNGYVLERQGRRICVAGDTAETNFSAVGRLPTDVMIAPIGAYDPWIASHCTPEQAVDMANQARARYVVPVHHQTFRLSWEPMDEPIQRFTRALEPRRIALTSIGQTFVLPEKAVSSPIERRTGRTIDNTIADAEVGVG